LRRPRVVGAVVERHPTPSELVGATNLVPGEATTHSDFEPVLPCFYVRGRFILRGTPHRTKLLAWPSRHTTPQTGSRNGCGKCATDPHTCSGPRLRRRPLE